MPNTTSNEENNAVPLREQLVRWMQRYAKNRTIPFLVQWVIIVAMVTAVGVAANLTSVAHQTRNNVLFYSSVTAMGAAMLFILWFSASRQSGLLVDSVVEWFYGREGYVTYRTRGENERLPLWLTALGGGLVAWHLAGAILVSYGYLTLATMQPFSALYMAPFLAAMILRQQLGFWAWIWPALYAAHAMLLFAGAPIAFTGYWQVLNLAVPVFGYGLAAILAGHLFSRYALWKIKQLSRAGLPENGGDAADE